MSGCMKDNLQRRSVTVDTLIVLKRQDMDVFTSCNRVHAFLRWYDISDDVLSHILNSKTMAPGG